MTDENENAYTGLFIEEEFILDSGEKIGFAQSDWLLEMGVLQADVDAATIRQQWRPARKERDKLLAESDWVVTKHAEAGTSVPTAWVTYREALRDITDQADVDNITWPTKP
jgi:hypothetical protein|tara:strand:+ start:457 stop:789 length:333 start_codon:yes stop_codon:yes gene_type:complete